MPQFSSYPSSPSIKMLYLGHCLGAKTIIHARRKSSTKQITIKTLFKRVNKPQRFFGETYLLSDIEGSVGFSLISQVIKAGKKPLFKLQTEERGILVSADHLFSTPNGWARTNDLTVGDPVFSWRTTRTKDVHTDKKEGGRVYIYSIPYHPFAQQNWVAGRDYKRYPRARITVEAALNGLELQEFVSILRNDSKISSTFQYLSLDVDVHHLNGIKSDDRIENLQVLNRSDHMQQHHPEVVKASKAIDISYVNKIEEVEPDETYDIVMENDPHNFIANGFVVHNSGAGKTGSLCSLAAAGYNIRILDLDEKAEVIRDLVTNPKSIYLRERAGLWTADQARDTASRISYIPMSETMTIQGTKAVPRGDAWQRSMQQLNNWVDGDQKLGNISKWTEQDILVIDSFSRLCEAAMNFQLAMNNRLLTGPSVGTSKTNDYSGAYAYINGFLNLLKDKSIRCNVIVIGHIVFMEPSGPQTTLSRETKGFAQVFGRAMISPTISQYFPHVLRAKSIGNDPSVIRTIITNNDENVELITTAPLSVPREYKLETGLAEYFRDIKATQNRMGENL